MAPFYFKEGENRVLLEENSTNITFKGDTKSSVEICPDKENPEVIRVCPLSENVSIWQAVNGQKGGLIYPYEDGVVRELLYHRGGFVIKHVRTGEEKVILYSKEPIREK